MDATTVQRPVLLVGGKGGVGKTTCSAAIATQLAASGIRTLIITSDLSPSLSDVFDTVIGDRVTTIGANLDAYEISQDAIVAWWRKQFGKDFTDILSHIVDVEALDRGSQHQLLDYIGSAPSLREETMLDVIRDMAEGREYDRVVWDTAPAGETLNLLSMPQNIRKHIRAGAKVFEGLDMIGKRLIGKRSIAAIMDDWARASERISRFIHERSSFVIVSNPEALVVNQVERMMATLEEFQLPIHGLVINCVIEQIDSPSLIEMRKVQATYIEDLKRMAGDRPFVILPRSLTEIRGIPKLQEIGGKLLKELAL